MTIIQIPHGATTINRGGWEIQQEYPENLRMIIDFTVGQVFECYVTDFQQALDNARNNYAFIFDLPTPDFSPEEVEQIKEAVQRIINTAE